MLDDLARGEVGTGLNYRFPAEDYPAAVEALERYVEESGVGVVRKGYAPIDLSIIPASNGPGWCIQVHSQNRFSDIIDLSFEDASGLYNRIHDTRRNPMEEDAGAHNDYACWIHDIGAVTADLMGHRIVPRSSEGLENDVYTVRLCRVDTPQKLYRQLDETEEELRQERNKRVVTEEELDQLWERIDGRQRDGPEDS